MSEPDITAPESRTPESSEGVSLEQQCRDLRRQVSMLLLTFTVASFTLTAYLGLQNIRAGRDLDNVRVQRNFLAEQSRLEAPGIQAFISKLAEYGQTHSDFQPILAKYSITNVPAKPPVAPALPAAQPKK